MPSLSRPKWLSARLILPLALLLAILGAKFIQLDRYASDLPYWDQWDAEGDFLLRPYIEGTLKAGNIIGPHNEHRPALTRLLVLGLFEANDRIWDARVEMIANAVLHAALALLLLNFARRFLPPGALLGFAVLLAILFGQPVSWENTLAGFQSQFYFILLFSALHLSGTLLTQPRSFAWWLAPLAGIGALFSMASGLLSALAIIAVVVARALRDRRITWEDAYALAPNALFCIAGWLLKSDVPGHATLKAQSLGTWLSAFLHQYSWPVIDLWAAPIGMLPAAVLAFAYFRRRVDGPVAQVLLAACTWFMLQAAALAYGRGGDGAAAGSRYVDTLCIGVAIHLLTFGYLAYASDERGRRRWLVFGGVFIALLFAGLIREMRFTLRDALNAMPGINEARIATVRSYLASRGPAFFEKSPWTELPYPDAARFAKLLDTPALKRILPMSVRPAVPLVADENTTRAFARHQPNATLGPKSQDLSAWSSAPGEAARFVSAPFAIEQKRITVFAACDGTGKNQLHLVDEHGQRIAPLGALPYTPRWKRLNFSVAAGRYRLEAGHEGPGWFAFTAPITGGMLSNLAMHIPHAGGWLLAGAALLGILAWRQTGSLAVSRLRAWRQVGSATLALGFAFALAAGLHRQIFFDPDAGDEATRFHAFPRVANFALFDPTATHQPGSRFVGAAFVVRGSASEWLGTYVGGDAFTGRVLSTTFPVVGDETVVPIIGYPNSKTNRLTLEILDAAQQPEASVAFTGENPREIPGLWRISTAAWQGRQARLVLVDGDTASGGWLAVGPPIERRHRGADWTIGMTRNYAWFSAAALGCTALLFLPGLALRTWWPTRFPLGAALLALPGLLGLVVFGLLSWICGAAHLRVLANVWLLAHIGVGVVLAKTWWRDGGPLRASETAKLGIYAAVVVGALAFGALPLEVGQEYSARSTQHARMIASPPDHTIPYQTAVYFFHGKNGREKSAEYFGGSWSAASRGPLVPLAIAGALALFDAHPKDPPTSAFDRWPAANDGFYLARILGVLTNALVILAVAALIARLAPAAETNGLVWLAVAPVISINTDFLWPKLLATFFFLLAVQSAIERRSALRLGIWSALAYLSHPVGGLFLPPLVLFVAHLAWFDPAEPATRWRAVARRLIAFALAVLACITPWLVFKAWVGGHDVFLDYPVGDGRGFARAASVATWLSCRWNNLWLTLLPGGFYFSGNMQNWLDGPLSEPLRWAIGYAKTLPGALGFAGFGLAVVALARHPSPAPAGFRRHLLLGAFVFALVFWGFSSDGLGRNCLEPLAVLLLGYAVSALPAAWPGWRWVLLATALETLSIRVIGVTAAKGFFTGVLDAESLLLAALVAGATLAPALWFFFRRGPRSDVRHRERTIARPVIPFLLSGLLVLVLALAAFAPRARVTQIAALDASAPPWNEISFREGAYYGDPTGIPRGIATRGSRVDGADAWQGEFLSGWFKAAPRLTVFVTGYPRTDGNRLEIEVRSARGTLTTLPFERFNPRESWFRWEVELPQDAAAFRVHAIDRTTEPGGWLAVSEPFVGRLHPTLLPQGVKALLAFALQAALFTLLGLLLTRALRLEEKFEAPTVVLVAGAAVATIGYCVFWMYFLHPLAGRILSWCICVGAVLASFARRRDARSELRFFQPVMLATLIGAFYIALLGSFESPSFSFSAANRFIADLPADNEIPRVFAERLWKGESTHALFGEWLSSDRPPLQTGWLLITWPVLERLGFDSDTASAAAGVCFQLLWVPAVMALVFHLGANARQSLAVTAALAFNGVFLVYSIFVWPKFGAAALVIGCYLLIMHPQSRRLYFAVAGGCAALSWLAHGGVAFSLLGLAPLAFLLRRAADWRCWLVGAFVFAAFATPWIAYQRWHDPPGDRLIKWHLAGVIPIDSRSAGQALRDQYRQTPLAQLVRNRWENTKMLFGGHWLVLPRSPETRDGMRNHELHFTVRAWCFWNVAWAVPLVGWWWVKRPDASRSRQITLLVWLALSVAAWVLLMFIPTSTIVHQGTLVTQLGSFALLAWWALDWRRSFFIALALAQTAWFVCVWTQPGLRFEGRLDRSAATVAVLTGILLLAVAVWAALSSSRRTLSPPSTAP